jgi:O-antigen ligase
MRLLAARLRSLRRPRLPPGLHLGLYAIGLMWVAPFLVPVKAPPVPTFHAEALAMGLGLAALIAAPAWVARLPPPRVALLPLGFVLLILLQMALRRLGFDEHGLLASLFLLWAAALMVLATLLRRELGLERVATTLAWFLFAGLVACDIIGVTQRLESYAFLRRYITIGSGARVWGNLAQPNHLADYMSLGLASLTYLFAIGRLRWAYALAIGALSLYILSLTGSRAAWFYLGALGALSAAFYGFDRTAVNRRLLIASVAALAGLYAIPLLVELLQPPSLPAPITASERLLSTFTYEQRPPIFRAAWLMFLGAPVLGVGFKQFGIQHFILNVNLPEPRVPGFTDNAHNLFLQVAAEFGLVGLLVLLAGAIPWVVGLVRQPRTPAFWWVLALACTLGIHSMLEYPLWYAFFLGVAAIVLGLGEARTLELTAAEARLRRMRVAVWSMLLLGGLVFVQVVRDYLCLENFLAFRYRYVHATAELDQRAREMLRDLHRSWLLSPWVELALARTIHVSPERLADKLAVNTRAMRGFPIDDVVYRQAMLLALAGEQAAARKQWDRAVASFPSLRAPAVTVLRRLAEDGRSELEPLLAHAENAN